MSGDAGDAISMARRSYWVDRSGEKQEGYHYGGDNDFATIVVEFVSASKRDRGRDSDEKVVEYHAAGMSEYWIIDRFQRTMTAHRHADGAPTSIPVGEHATYQTDLLPGFDLPPSRLLAKADLWPAKKRSRKPPAGGDA